MNFAIFVVDIPTADNYESEQKMGSFLARSESTIKTISPENTLGKNCWLLDMQKNLLAFSNLARVADQYGLSYRVLFLEDEPEWCLSNPIA